MKKVNLILVCFLLGILSQLTVFGQFTIECSGGYSFGTMKKLVGNNTERTTTSVTQKGVYASFGKGGAPGIIIGLKMGNRMQCLLGYSTVLSQKVFYTDHEIHSSNQSFTSSYTMQSSMMRLCPGLRIVFGEKKIQFFTSAFFVFGLGSKMRLTENSVFEYNSIPTYQQAESKYFGGLSAGFRDEFGATYEFGKLGVFLGLDFIFQNWAPKYGKINDEKFQFSNPGFQPNMDPDKLPQYPKINYSFSSFGINLGLSYKIGNN